MNNGVLLGPLFGQFIAPLVFIDQLQAKLVFQLVIPALKFIDIANLMNQILRIFCQGCGPHHAHVEFKGIQLFPVADMVGKPEVEVSGIGPVILDQCGDVLFTRGKDQLAGTDYQIALQGLRILQAVKKS